MTRGGRRARSGRPPKFPGQGKVLQVSFCITRPMLDYLIRYGNGNRTAGLQRLMIEEMKRKRRAK